MGDTEGTALPPGWAWARLDEVCDIVGGITVDAKRRGAGLVDVPYLRVANVQRGRLDLGTVKQIAVPPSQAERLRLHPGDVLLNEGGDRDKVGRGWVWEGQIEGCIFQNHVFRARPRHEDVQPRWLSHYLNEAARSYFLTGSKQTTNLASLSLSKVAATPVALPPANEQRRIIKAIDSLLVEVDDVEAAMKRARERMADYRVSLLHAACTGALTTDWRDVNPNAEEDGPALLRRILAERHASWERAELARLTAAGKMPRGEGWKQRYSEPISADSTDLPTLPPSWSWATIDQLTHFMGNGLSRKPVSHETNTPILRISAVRPLRVDRSQRRFYEPQHDEVLESATATPGDLLFTRYSGSEHFVGVCGMLRGGEPVLYPDKIMNARPVSLNVQIGSFIEIMLAGGASRQFIKANIRTTAGQKGIAGSAVRACPVPLPPSSELKAVVDAFIEAFPPEVDTSSVATAGSEAINDLRQSILHAAFSGRLVPQNPDDEPATALLARLRAEATQFTPRRRSARAGALP